MTRDTFCHDGKALTELIDKAINITGMPHMRADKVQTRKGLSSLRPLRPDSHHHSIQKAASCLAPPPHWKPVASTGTSSVTRARPFVVWTLYELPGPGILITSQTSASS